jgi:hypothetical protein
MAVKGFAFPPDLPKVVGGRKFRADGNLVHDKALPLPIGLFPKYPILPELVNKLSNMLILNRFYSFGLGVSFWGKRSS